MRCAARLPIRMGIHSGPRSGPCFGMHASHKLCAYHLCAVVPAAQAASPPTCSPCCHASYSQYLSANERVVCYSALYLRYSGSFYPGA